MNRLGVLGVGVLALLIVGYKVWSKPHAQTPAATPSSSASIKAVRGPMVLLFADLGEADSECGCGEIIRAVRSAGKRGVPVREFAPEADGTAEKQYRIAVTPTVVILSGTGGELQRFEGESDKVISALRSRLETLGGGK